MSYLIKISVVLTFAKKFTGNLPRILYQVRKAQILLIIETQASKWPKAT